MFSSTTNSYHHQPPSSSTTPAQSSQPSLPKPCQNIPLNKIPTELQEQRDKGLYYTAD